MHIATLSIEHIRNIQSATLSPSPHINVILGQNGAGKTSILESIYMASVGRSFRSHKSKNVIQHNQDFLRLVLSLEHDGITTHKLGLQRNAAANADFIVRINGENVSALSELSALLPVSSFDSNTFNLLDGGSSERRGFLDFGVFHVEHQFVKHWKQYKRLIKQRSALLRAEVTDYQQYAVWDAQIAKHAAYIELFRLQYLASFKGIYTLLMEQFNPELVTAVRCIYSDGWSESQLWDDIQVPDNAETFVSEKQLQYQQKLTETFDKDFQYKRTQYGAHKADLLFKHATSNILMKDTLSRGQKKIFIAALKLAQAEGLHTLSSKHPILLLDDLPSEFDQDHLTKIMAYLSQSPFQSFISAIQIDAFEGMLVGDHSVFHVEHGIPVTHPVSSNK